MNNSLHTDSSNSNSKGSNFQTNILYSTLLKIVNETKNQVQLEKGFIKVAKLLLLQSNLMVSNKAYQLLDIEFYFYNKDFHPDPYSHSFQYASSVRKKQSVTGSWYFHRFTGIEKYTHTRRGIDVTYGDGEKEKYGGILIRAIKDLQDNRIITGPSRVVGEIISAINNPKKLEEIAFDMNAGLAFDHNSLIFLNPLKSAKSIPLYSTVRFGITDKDPLYQRKHYRFFTDLSTVKKPRIFEYQDVVITKC